MKKAEKRSVTVKLSPGLSKHMHLVCTKEGLSFDAYIEACIRMEREARRDAGWTARAGWPVESKL